MRGFCVLWKVWGWYVLVFWIWVGDALPLFLCVVLAGFEGFVGGREGGKGCGGEEGGLGEGISVYRGVHGGVCDGGVVDVVVG